MFKLITGTRQNLTSGRFLTTMSSSAVEELDRWISSVKEQVLDDALHPERLSDLYITLPTRDGIRSPYAAPVPCTPLGYGHHLAFFYPRVPESLLLDNGTDGDFCPPPPFSRRMWASGKMSWDNEHPMLIGERAKATMTVASVEKKGFDRGRPMVFVNKRMEVAMQASSKPSIVEERMHVYLPVSASAGTVKKPTVRDENRAHDFSFTYKPSLTTLFRFSAMIFNAHHIHLDKDYAVQKQGYKERLVHGPLTALMLLETVVFNRPDTVIKTFSYTATAPLVVRQENTIYGKYEGPNTIKLWCESEDGTVGMRGEVTT